MLPEGGGTVCGLYDLSPAKFGSVNNLITSASDYGRQTQIYNGVDLIIAAQLGNGAQVSGGLNTGRTATNNCFVVDSPQQLRFCDVTPPFQSQVKLLVVYPLPWWGLQASSVIVSAPGPEIRANYVATNAEIAPTLKRNLAAGPTATAVVNLIKPGTMYEDRTNQVDLRLTKNFRVRQARLEANIDVFNLLNASGVTGLIWTYGANWLQPTLLQGARRVEFSGRFTF
jgi:hypothetical protein